MLKILKKILLVIELAIYILIVNWDKILFVTVVALDQFVKGIIAASMIPGESIPIFKHIFHITYVLNPGAAFGILPHQRELFLFAGALILIATFIFYIKMKNSDGTLKFGLITLISGATANLIDRFQNGLVIDFIDLRVWPVFNIADVAIIIGVCCMIYSIVFRMEESGIEKIEKVVRD